MTRIPDETDAQFRHRIDGQRKTADLKRLLFALGIKSARKVTLITSFAGMTIRVPGIYANIKNMVVVYE